jgi:hypothetical protein
VPQLSSHVSPTSSLRTHTLTTIQLSTCSRRSLLWARSSVASHSPAPWSPSPSCRVSQQVTLCCLPQTKFCTSIILRRLRLPNCKLGIYAHIVIELGLVKSDPLMLPGRHALNAGLLLSNLAAMAYLYTTNSASLGLGALSVNSVLASVMGVTLTMAIGGTVSNCYG